MQSNEGEIGSGEETGRIRPTRLLRVPLNSKRLTAGHLRRLAEALQLPTTTSADELCQMIDGKLIEEGKDPHNVQVVLEGVEPKSEFSLEDADGRFLDVSVETEEDLSGGYHEPSDGEGEEEGETDVLRRERILWQRRAVS